MKMSTLAFLLNTQIDILKYYFTEYVLHTLFIADKQELSIF